METPLIEIKNLTKIYFGKKKSVKALDDVSLDINSKDFIAIVGRSGAGKTTLLNLVGGLEKPVSGTVKFHGKVLGDLSSKDLAHLRMKNISFIFQNFNLLPAYTVYENIEIAVAPVKLSKKEQKKRIEEMLHTFNLEEKTDCLPSELSVGQQQKVAIARALVNHPVLILADEPTGAVDPVTAKGIIEELVKLNKQYNITLVVVTHNLQQYSFANKVIYMKDGRIATHEEVGY